jgi:hypothetical protein
LTTSVIRGKLKIKLKSETHMKAIILHTNPDNLSNEDALLGEIDAAFEEMLDTPFSFWSTDQSFTQDPCSYCQQRDCDC